MGYYFLLITAMAAYRFPQQKPTGTVLLVVPAESSGVAPKTCAISLVNVLRQPWQFDKMVVHVPQPRHSSGDIVAPPAPSCDDVKY